MTAKMASVRFFLTMFLGGLGVHKFAQKKYIMGVIYLFTFGLFGIGWCIDTILAAVSWYKAAAGEEAPVAAEPAASAAPAAPDYSSSFFVQGTRYYKDNIIRTAKANYRYKMSAEKLIQDGWENRRVYQYYFADSPVVLVPEPENPHDRNAIRVDIAGQTVGYIDRDETKAVRALMQDNAVATAKVSGGKSKVVLPDGEILQDDYNIKVVLYFNK